jgi:hypothetical protein
MRNQTPLAPGQPYDVTVHLVLNDFGERLGGHAYVETDEAEADQNTIIENIIAGLYSRPLRVVAFNTAEGWARDVTKDVARTVSDCVRSEQRTLTKGTQQFLEHVLGLGAPIPIDD